MGEGWKERVLVVVVVVPLAVGRNEWGRRVGAASAAEAGGGGVGGQGQRRGRRRAGAAERGRMRAARKERGRMRAGVFQSFYITIKCLASILVNGSKQGD
jgi:hypothetical protein